MVSAQVGECVFIDSFIKQPCHATASTSIQKLAPAFLLQLYIIFNKSSLNLHILCLSCSMQPLSNSFVHYHVQYGRKKLKYKQLPRKSNKIFEYVLHSLFHSIINITSCFYYRHQLLSGMSWLFCSFHVKNSLSNQILSRSSWAI